MAIEFIKVRRKDDHTVTTQIARDALRLWAEWEPVPDGEPTTPPEPSGSPSEGPANPTPDPTNKRRAAATDGKEK